MKRLIKLAVLIVILGVFTFSNNPIIEKGRNATLKFGRVLYEKGMDKMLESENKYVRSIPIVLNHEPL